MSGRTGKVYLVGAGPGDPGLISVKGLQCIREADMLVYDRLVSQELLQEAKAGAEMVYAGKAPGQHIMEQEAINQLLCREALSGKIVTRLKGGDPFIFGRGGEELEALVEAGVQFEVVPGITSAIGAAAYAGIPLTHRAYCSTVALISGHEDSASGELAVDWQGLARGTGTLVFLMGVGNLGRIVAKLRRYGRPANTPVALIQWGTYPEQRTVSGSLEDICEKVQAAGLTSPAVIVVGEVVQLRERLSWFEQKPLSGQRILVTRPRQQAGELTHRLLELGAKVLEVPVIEIIPPEDWTLVDHSISQLGKYDWVILTSINGVEYFLQRIFAHGLDVRVLAGVKLAATGQETAQRLSRYGLRADYLPEQFTSEALAAGLCGLADLKEKKVLLARAQEANAALPDSLRQAGAEVDDVAVYRTVAGPGCENLAELLCHGQVDIVTFTCSSAVQHLARLIEPLSLKQALAGLQVACIGPVTAQTVTGLGGRVDWIAAEHSIAGLVSLLQSRVNESEVHCHETDSITSSV